jgi:deoxyadenosine/deoxycytidine kinase
MKYKFITVEGNIGAGKTTLVNLLASKLKAKIILEQFADNPFLPKFYQEPSKYGFPLELSFLADRFKQLKEILNTRDLFNEVIISDYLFIKSKLFAKVNLPDDEYKLYETLFDIIYPNLPQPDLLIYLYAPIEKIKQNIKSRNRDYEQNIKQSYLETLSESYQQLIRSGEFTTLLVDTTYTDFLNNENQLNQLLSLLENDYAKGTHYIDLSE